MKTQQIDKHLGIKLKEARVKAGLTQTKIANILNITYQQIQKYGQSCLSSATGAGHATYANFRFRFNYSCSFCFNFNFS